MAHLHHSLLGAGKWCLCFETEIEKSLLRKILHLLNFQAAAFGHDFTLNKCLLFVFNNKDRGKNTTENGFFVFILESELTLFSQNRF